MCRRIQTSTGLIDHRPLYDYDYDYLRLQL